MFYEGTNGWLETHNRRDLGDLDLFEREIPFDLGDLSARDDTDLYTRDFFETELSERDFELLERGRTSYVFFLLFFVSLLCWRTYSFCSMKSNRGGPPRPPTPPVTPPPQASNSRRDLADDSDLLERDFDDFDLLERDFEELEARESIWTKIR